ncbi:unnamed protein product, partial [Prorocentrum cordatum]
SARMAWRRRDGSSGKNWNGWTRNGKDGDGGRDAANKQYVVRDVCSKWKWLSRVRKDPLCRCGSQLLQGDGPDGGVDRGESAPNDPQLQKTLGGGLQGLFGPPQLARFKTRYLAADMQPEAHEEPDAVPALAQYVGLAKRAMQRATTYKKECQAKVGQLKEQLAQAEATLDVATSQEEAAKQEAVKKSQQRAELVNPDGTKALQAFMEQHPRIAAKYGQQVPKAAVAPVGPQGAAKAAAAASGGAPPSAKGPAGAPAAARGGGKAAPPPAPDKAAPAGPLLRPPPRAASPRRGAASAAAAAAAEEEPHPGDRSRSPAAAAAASSDA